MAQASVVASESTPQHPLPTKNSGAHGFFRKFFGRQSVGNVSASATKPSVDAEHDGDLEDLDKAGLVRRLSRKAVPGLPRVQTFKRQQSERRINLAPVEPTADERRAVSVDRRFHEPRASSPSQTQANPRVSAPSFLGFSQDEAPHFVPSLPVSHMMDEPAGDHVDQMIRKDDDVTLAEDYAVQDNFSTADTHSITPSQYDAMVHEELEKTWILNLSMHFRDRSKREKFFVTYREREHMWRRVTISLDYRYAPPNSLEMDLIHTQFQRDKSSKIYEAIRESLRDIQFYDTVTNLKLQTTDGRLHVHVVEDGNEIIQFPTVPQIKHLGCRRIRERDITFDSHMSGFVYKVQANGRTLIKKEIPSPDTVDEFLYEVNALNRLRYSRNVIHFHGVVVDDNDEYVKGLLIEYADQGALIDVIYEHCKDGDFDLPWGTRERWARQIVEGLSDIHESGFVQGDFTLSNIVIDENGDAKIIDINRRGCPVGWEPPEAIPLIEGNQRISMYIGVKSDLYQLGMVLWALATQEDEPEAQGRPLILGPEVNIPDWYRQMAEICLSDDPRMRLQASSLLNMFPQPTRAEDQKELNPPRTPSDEGYTLQKYLVDEYQPETSPEIRTVEQPSDWSYVNQTYTDASHLENNPYYYTRGRSPPSPLPSNYDACDSLRGFYDRSAWAANKNIPSSYSDIGPDGMLLDETPVGNKPAPMDTEPFTPSASTMGGVELPLTPSTFVDPNKDIDTPTPASTAKGQVGIIAAEVNHRIELGGGEETQDSRLQAPHSDDLTKDVPRSPELSSAEGDVKVAKIETSLSVCVKEAEADDSTIQEADKNRNDGPDDILSMEDEVPAHIVNNVDDAARLKNETETRPEVKLETVKGAGITAPEPHLAEQNIGLEETKALLQSDDRLIPRQQENEHQCASGSLTGVGAVHLMDDDNAIRQKQMTDEDFSTVKGPMESIVRE